MVFLKMCSCILWGKDISTSQSLKYEIISKRDWDIPAGFVFYGVANEGYNSNFIWKVLEFVVQKF